MNRILIIKLGSLGDVLRTTCILPGLARKYPNAYIDWLTSPAALTLLANNSVLNRILTIDDLHSSDPPNTQYDLVVNLDDDDRACEFASSISTDQLIGAYLNKRLKNYTEDSAKWFDMSLISRFGKERADQLKKDNSQTYPSILFEMLDISPGKPTLEIPDREKTFARSFSHRHSLDNHLVIGLNTGAGSRWRFKKLSEKKTAELITLLTDSLGATILLFGGPKEEDRNSSIQNLTSIPIVNAGYNNTLIEFSALITLCNLLITSDSLALHIASCLSVPVVTFFGPTSANEIEIFSSGTKIVPDMDCICCYKPDCNFDPTCMDNISAQVLSESAKKILSLEK